MARVRLVRRTLINGIVGEPGRAVRSCAPNYHRESSVEVLKSMDAADITGIAARLLRAPFALFAGAGLSRAAGIPVAGELQEYVLRCIGLSNDDLAVYWKAVLPFETFFEVLLSTTDCARLFPLFDL